MNIKCADPTRRFAWLMTVGALGCLPVAAQGKQFKLGAIVPAKQRISINQVDHRSWDALLKRYVDARGNVAYQRWKQSATDNRSLNAYLAHLSAADPQLPAGSAAKMAFWINAYNAVTIHGILREYPTTSIRNHTKTFGYNIWDDLLLIVGGKSYSLSQIEHEILRKSGDPRIHFAIVCASRSCPRLLNGAYVGDQLESQLTANAKDFFAQPGNFQFDQKRKRFYLSSILKWFADDFGDNQAAQMLSISPYLPSRAAYEAARANAVSISYLKYDWGLNDQ